MIASTPLSHAQGNIVTVNMKCLFWLNYTGEISPGNNYNHIIDFEYTHAICVKQEYHMLTYVEGLASDISCGSRSLTLHFILKLLFSFKTIKWDVFSFWICIECDLMFIYVLHYNMYKYNGNETPSKSNQHSYHERKHVSKKKRGKKRFNVEDRNFWYLFCLSYCETKNWFKSVGSRINHPGILSWLELITRSI